MAKILELNSMNPWWRHGQDFEKFDSSLRRTGPIFFERKPMELKKGNIYVLKGPRQVGKTTYFKDIVRKLIKEGIPKNDILYLSLDFFTSRRELRNAINYFLEKTRDSDQIYFLLDEITSIENWILELKYIADLGILNRAIVLATGSSARKLKEKGELLPGRGVEGNEYYIKPLSFREFALQSISFISQHQKNKELSLSIMKMEPVLRSLTVDLSSDMDSISKAVCEANDYKREIEYLFRLYLTTGGMPAVINYYYSKRYLQNTDAIEPQAAETYTRDVLGDLARLQKQETIAKQILRALVERYGSRYSYSNLSKGIERTHVTTIDYLEFMEDSFICFILYAYDFNKKRPKLKGEKKTYFFDPFIYYSMRSLLSGKEVWDVICDSLEDEELLASIVEGTVLSHLRMHGEIPFQKTADTFLWFYYDSSGREIDAIFNDGEEYAAIEVKFQSSVDERDIMKLNQANKNIILSRNDTGREGNKMIIPVDVFLSLLPVSRNNL